MVSLFGLGFGHDGFAPPAEDLAEERAARAALVEEARASRSSMRAVVKGLFAIMRAAGCQRAASVEAKTGEVLASSEASWGELSEEEEAVWDLARREGFVRCAARVGGAFWIASLDRAEGVVTLALWPEPSRRPLPRGDASGTPAPAGTSALTGSSAPTVTGTPTGREG